MNDIVRRETISLTSAKSIVAKLGFTLTVAAGADYRLAPKAGTQAEREAQAYYTSDLADALATAQAIRARQRVEGAVTVPTISLHGSDRRTLIGGYCEALASLRRAHIALCATLPHGRDYPNTDVLMVALTEHRVRIAMIDKIMTDIAFIAEGIRPE